MLQKKYSGIFMVRGATQPARQTIRGSHGAPLAEKDDWLFSRCFPNYLEVKFHFAQSTTWTKPIIVASNLLRSDYCSRRQKTTFSIPKSRFLVSKHNTESNYHKELELTEPFLGYANEN